MSNEIHYKMICLELLYLVSFVSITTSIRVDWNTNSGPIIPPTSTLPSIPRQPFRPPAPVWEDLRKDAPDVNPYRYVLPPPSRPKPSTDNYLRGSILSIQQHQQQNYYQHQQQQQQQNHAQLVTKLSNNNFYYKTVPSLAAEYVPNIGLKYNAIIPQTNNKLYYLKENDIYDNERFTERYNAKLKKYKAFERIKNLPQTFHTTPFQYHYLPLYQQQQQLPYVHQQFQFKRQTPTDQQTGGTQQSYYQQVPQPQQQKSLTSLLNQTKPQTFKNLQPTYTIAKNNTNNFIQQNQQPTHPSAATKSLLNSQLGGSTKSR